MIRLFLPTIKTTDKSIVIDGQKAYYLLSVLRSRRGDHLIVYDGRGTCFKVAILDIRKRAVLAEVLESLPCDLESPLHSILAQGILKGEKMDFVVQKTTELGINEIVPVVTERSQVRDTRKVMRWRTIAEEAARQSGRTIVPTVCDPIDFRQYIAALSQQSAERTLIFYEEGGISFSQVCRIMYGEQIEGESRESAKDRSAGYGFVRTKDGASDIMSPVPFPIRIVIGPEGGFTKAEVSDAKEHGCIVVSLGKRILRAETAAISALTLVQYLFGDMG